LQQPIEDIAVNFLLSHYITGSQFEYLLILSKVAVTGGSLLACVRAVGLASISRSLGHPEVMDSARWQYSRALRMTNEALQTPEKAILDDTLASVMLLALFEIVAHQNQEPSDQWAGHINGALTLLVLRGSSQFRSAIGLLLFRQVSSSIRANSVQHKLRIPPGLLYLRAQASPYIDIANPVWRFTAITDALTDLRASTEHGQITEPVSVIRRATQVDNEARSLSLDMPEAWSYVVAYSSADDVAVFERTYHIYKDHRAAQMWNTIRMTRMLLNEIIHENLAKARSDSCGTVPDCSSLREHYASVSRAMTTEILASVPQFTEFSPSGSTLFSPNVASSCFLLWPLEAVASSPRSTTSMRSYAMDRLRYMGSQMNVRQALEVVEKLEEGCVSQDWYVFSAPSSVATRKSP
jgi:Fungal specific transcription factor domain